MISSDARNKEIALARIKRLASSCLPLEPFVRTSLELLNDGVPFSPNRVMLAGIGGNTGSCIDSTKELAAATPLFREFFSDAPIEISGLRFRYDALGLATVLPSRIIRTLEDIALPDFLCRDGLNALYRPLGSHHLVQVVFEESGEFAGYCPIWRTADQKPFSAEDVDFLRASATHIAHGLKLAQLQRSTARADTDFAPLAGCNAGSILLGPDACPIAMDAHARLIFQQIGVIDGVKADAFQPPQIRNALAYISATLKDIFHNPDSGPSATGPPVARFYAHWSGIVLKLRGCRMAGADGREFTTVIIERGETAEARRRRMIARWGLSRREGEVLDLIVASKTGPEIAILLGLSHDTVRKHTSGILAKLGAETRAAAVSLVRDFT